MFRATAGIRQEKNTEIRSNLKVGDYKEQSPVTGDLATGGR
jgi:hypothetical protein